MFSLILLVIFAIIFGYFATQNTQTITVTLYNYTISSIPLYIVIGAALLIGLSLSWLISLSGSVSTAMKIRGKESTIKDAKKNIHDLTKQVNQLEIENARLKGKVEEEQVDDESL